MQRPACSQASDMSLSRDIQSPLQMSSTATTPRRDAAPLPRQSHAPGDLEQRLWRPLVHQLQKHARDLGALEGHGGSPISQLQSLFLRVIYAGFSAGISQVHSHHSSEDPCWSICSKRLCMARSSVIKRSDTPAPHGTTSQGGL